MAQIPASENEFPEVLFAEGAAPSTPAAGLVKAYAKADGLLYAKDDAGAETPLNAAAHIADTTDAHDASAVSFDPTGLGSVTGTEVQTAIEELDAAVSGGGIPATIVDGKGELIVATAADTVDNLAAGTNGQHLVAASGETTGVKWTWEGSVKDFGFVRYTGGDITADADTAFEDLGISDIVLAAATGDIVEVSFSAMCNNSTNVLVHFDCVTIVSAAPVNSLGSGAAVSDSNRGVACWSIIAGVASQAGGSIMYTLQAGDISSGTVTLRMRDKPQGTTNRVVDGTTALPIHFSAKNLGPAI